MAVEQSQRAVPAQFITSPGRYRNMEKKMGRVKKGQGESRMKNLYPEADQIIQSLVKEMETFETVDCHEHLIPETKRVAMEVDVFTLFSHYTQGDLRTSGMSESDCSMLQDTGVPLEYRWQKFQPYWDLIRWSSYSRAVLIAAHKFYGVEDIHEGNYLRISRDMKAANKPGLYRQVLKDACRLKVSLLQCAYPEADTALFAPVVHMPFFNNTATWDTLSRPAFNPAAKVNSLDDYLGEAWDFIRRVKAKGAVGLKMMNRPNLEPDRKEAAHVFDQLKNGNVPSLPDANPLTDYIYDRYVSFAEEHGLVVAVHTGYWGDFRKLDPLHLIPLLQRHPKARFDVYHLGYPWGRETLMLAKNHPNVWLNLCWTHIISQRFAQNAMDEALDLIPINKILAFGGDYGKPVEKVYGHLVMAREDMAGMLAGRISDGRLSEGQAVNIARKWFCENPCELYGIKIGKEE